MNIPVGLLDSVSIASPCNASWEAMSGDERSRYCAHCTLNVYNLSDMSRDEAETFLEKAEGRVCIRLYKRADGSIITRDCPVGEKAIRQRLIRRVRLVAGTTLTLIGGLAGLNSALSFSRDQAAARSHGAPDPFEGNAREREETLGIMVMPPNGDDEAGFDDREEISTLMGDTILSRDTPFSADSKPLYQLPTEPEEDISVMMGAPLQINEPVINEPAPIDSAQMQRPDGNDASAPGSERRIDRGDRQFPDMK